MYDRAVTLDRIAKVSDGLLRMNHWAQAKVHRRTLPALSPYQEEIISDLSSDGVHVTSVERLFPDVGSKILNSLARAASYIPAEAERAESPSMKRLAASTDLLPDELRNPSRTFISWGCILASLIWQSIISVFLSPTTALLCANH